MGDAALRLVEHAMAQPWVYLALFAIAAIDGFLPVAPSETAVITAGVFAANGKPNVVGVIAVAALGAFCGDHVSYLIGRFAGGWLGRRLRPDGKQRKAMDWAGRTLGRRGGLILMVARYIPGGRTAITLTAGAVGYPLRSFSTFDAIGALSWGVYCTLIGYLGGRAFEHNPIAGLFLGLGVALGITLLVELIRHLRSRRRTDHEASDATRRAGRREHHDQRELRARS